MKLLTLATAFSLCLAFNLRAEDAAPSAEGKKEGAGECQKCKGKPSKEEILKKFDKDGDGKLSDEEKAAMPKHGKGHGKHEGKGKPEGEDKPE